MCFVFGLSIAHIIGCGTLLVAIFSLCSSFLVSAFLAPAPPFHTSLCALSLPINNQLHPSFLPPSSSTLKAPLALRPSSSTSTSLFFPLLAPQLLSPEV